MNNDANAEFFRKTLEQLDEWRHLPSYKLENRVDVFFGLFLGEVLNKEYGCDKDVVIIPEFPLHLGTIYPVKRKDSNQSVKVDFVALSETQNTVYLVELKTDRKSINKKQLCYLQKARDADFQKIVSGVFKSAAKSSLKLKYAHLISRMDNAGYLPAPMPESFFEEIENAQSSRERNKVMNKHFRKLSNELDAIAKNSSRKELLKIRVIYIAPEHDKAFENSAFECITFREFGNAISKTSAAGKVFAEYLEKWFDSAGEARLR